MSQHPKIFTEADLMAVAVASDTVNAFRAFLLDRFIVWTERHGAVDDLGAALPKTSPDGRSMSGYGHWRVAEKGTFTAPSAYRFENVLETGPGQFQVTHTASVPAGFIFDTDPDDGSDAYATYLSLRKRFEPNG